MSQTPYFLQVKYSKILGSSLDGFRIKTHDPFLAEARCPICGDSITNKHKRRFYFYTKESRLFVQCHNCQYSTTFDTLLRTIAEHLYRQMLFDRFQFEAPAEAKVEAKKVVTKEDWKGCLIPASMSLQAKSYLSSRLVPEKAFSRLYYTENLKHTYVDICNELMLDPDPDKKIPEISGVVFPFVYEDALSYIVCRNLDTSSSLRYVSISLQEFPKIYGTEFLDRSKKVVVVEGPMDSLFINNAVATGDAALFKASVALGRDNLVLFPDNEPRHKVQAATVGKMVDMGYSVVLLPHHIIEKDPNDLAKAGYDVNALIEENTYQGLQAKLKYKQWRLT